MSISVEKYLEAGYPVLYIQTGEQERAMQEILDSLKKSELGQALNVFVWKITTGLQSATGTNENVVAEGFDGALEYIAPRREEARPDSLYFFFNVKELFKSPVHVQRFRDAARRIRMVGSYMILIGGTFEVPEELEDVVTFVDLDLPSQEEIKAIFKELTDRYADIMEADKDPKTRDALLTQAAENALGLTALKAENAISLSLVTSKAIDIPLIRKEKQLAVKRSGVLEYIHHAETLETLGGFDLLKEHVSKRRKYFRNQQAARDFGLRPPKGVMLVGLPGTGKSLAAKSVSAALGLPLYKFDVGAVFKGVVGGSEASIRQALKLAETVAPCVLLIDEMEKLVAGLESSGKTDSGVTSRVIGTLISWMQETTAPIYKLATCNTIRNLDSALFRRGRWDAVFAVDLPTDKEREEIFSIHLSKRGRGSREFDLKKLAKISEGFVGAEIESVVDDALYHAFDDERDLETEDLLAVAGELVPISKTDGAAIDSFREWMKASAMPVSRFGKLSEKSSGGPRNLRVGGGKLQ